MAFGFVVFLEEGVVKPSSSVIEARALGGGWLGEVSGLDTSVVVGLDPLLDPLEDDPEVSAT